MSNNNHAMDEDDVDDFLYGDDTQEGDFGITSKPATKKNADEDDDNIYEQYNETIANSTTKPDVEVAEKTEAMEEDQEEDDDSDDDLDIILEPEENEQDVPEPASHASEEAQKSPNPLVNIKLDQQGNGPSNEEDKAKTEGGVDVDRVGDYNGQPITDLDVDIFEDKPWRKPGADITDYFNYGFNEVTWRAYCAKQKSMRDNKTTTTTGDMPMPDFMDMPDFMKMGMMMPMMDGGMMNPMMMGMPPPPPHHRPNGPPMGAPMMPNTNMVNRPPGSRMNYGTDSNQRSNSNMNFRGSPR